MTTIMINSKNKIPPIDVEQLYATVSKKSVPLKSNLPNFILPSSLPHANITKKTLYHLFNMEKSKGKYEGIKHQTFGGYHLLGDIESTLKMAYSFAFRNMSKYVAEGCIVMATDQLPKYKTFFQSLTKEELIQRFIESLQNVTSIDEKDTVWEVQGTSNDEIQITCIINKVNFDVITFYPTSKLSLEDQGLYEVEARNPYVRLNFNPCYPQPSTTPLTTAGSADLAEYFGNDGFPVNLQFVKIDSTTIEWSLYCRQQNLPPPRGQMNFTVLPVAVVEILKNEIIGLAPRELEILSTIEYLRLPETTVRTVFFDGHQQQRFPSYLNHFEVLNKFKEGLTNLLIVMQANYKETNESDWEDETPPISLKIKKQIRYNPDDWNYREWPVFPKETSPLPVTSKYALQLIHEEVLKQGWMEPGYPLMIVKTDGSLLRLTSFPTTLPIPSLGIDENNWSNNPRLAYLQFYANGTCYMDTWKFLVHFYPFTGIIEDFRII